MSKARAVLFGLNYQGTPNELYGCINDVLNMSNYLSKNGFLCKVCRDDIDPKGDCKFSGILRNLYEIILSSHTEKLDLILIHFSGHGTSVEDKNFDERDGRDECLVPSDFQSSGVITDDILNKIISYVRVETRVIFVNDCCHSGTMIDVKYSWETERKVAVENILCNIKSKVITLSGCNDDQTASDAYNVDGSSNTYTGALTSCLIFVLESVKSSKSDVFQLIYNLRLELKKRGFSQKPKLCSTYNITKNRAFLP